MVTLYEWEHNKRMLINNRTERLKRLVCVFAIKYINQSKWIMTKRDLALITIWFSANTLYITMLTTNLNNLNGIQKNQHNEKIIDAVKKVITA